MLPARARGVIQGLPAGPRRSQAHNVRMSDSPVFFLPHRAADLSEESFAQIAKICNRPVPPVGERVYSISFEHDGTLWIATVGEKLKGRKPVPVKHKRTGEWGPWFDDPALVLCIFPGKPHVVFTYGGSSSMGGHFGNAFFETPKPMGVTLFAHSSK
jgi:hypothetical protein